MLDAGAFANKDVEIYKKLANDFTALGLSMPEKILYANSFQELLDICKAVYLTDGLTITHIFLFININ